jgi:sulfonate dioxygenase
LLNGVSSFLKTNRTLLIKVQNSILSGEDISGGKYILFSVASSACRSNFRWRSSLHIHPTTSHPRNYPEIHLVYKSAVFTLYNNNIKCIEVDASDGDASYNSHYDEAITSTVWHSDVSYELQPPGLTTFFLFSQPRTGGDTLFTSQISALKKLSPIFIAFLKTLKAVHSGVEQAEHARKGKRGSFVRREPVENVHPVVRKHPVTGEEALYVNRQFTKRIVGLKREESGSYIPCIFF